MIFQLLISLINCILFLTNCSTSSGFYYDQPTPTLIHWMAHRERGPLTRLLAFKAHSRACGHHNDQKHHLHMEGLANMAQCGNRGSRGGYAQPQLWDARAKWHLWVQAWIWRASWSLQKPSSQATCAFAQTPWAQLQSLFSDTFILHLWSACSALFTTYSFHCTDLRLQ